MFERGWRGIAIYFHISTHSISMQIFSRQINYTHPKWKLYIVGFTMHENKHMYLKIQSFLGMLNFVTWGVSL